MNKAISHAAAEAIQTASMTYEQWIEAYKPIKNHLNECAPLDGTMFETFDSELQYVRKANEANTWTLVEGQEDEWILISGFHFVNRIGYVITEIPFAAKPGMDFLEVVVDDGDNPDYPKADWQQEVANGNTKLGYLDWRFHKEECDALGFDPRASQAEQKQLIGGVA